nr:unnamed protein product [Callosobruchus analis]
MMVFDRIISEIEKRFDCATMLNLNFAFLNGTNMLKMSNEENCKRSLPGPTENKPKNIIGRFVSKLDRDRFLVLAKKKRKTEGNRNGFKINGVSTRCFISEHRSTQAKHLYELPRDICKQKGVKCVWIQNGNIMTRKSETSRILQITTQEDLKKL